MSSLKHLFLLVLAVTSSALAVPQPLSGQQQPLERRAHTLNYNGLHVLTGDDIFKHIHDCPGTSGDTSAAIIPGGFDGLCGRLIVIYGDRGTSLKATIIGGGTSDANLWVTDDVPGSLGHPDGQVSWQLLD